MNCESRPERLHSNTEPYLLITCSVFFSFVKDGEEDAETPCWVEVQILKARQDVLVKLKVESITKRSAVLFVTTSKNALWAGYLIKLTNRKTMRSEEFRLSVQPGGVTSVSLSSLLLDTLYKIRVKPVQTFDQLKEWTNEISFKTLGIPPSFTKTPKKRIFLLIERNLTIECNASGVPKPTVKWTGSLLGPTQGRRKQQDGRLSISNVQINDSGNYTCEASNKEGVVSTTTELVVLADCFADWSGFGNICYKFETSSKKSWTNARADCLSYGGDLVSIHSAKEQAFISLNVQRSLSSGLSTFWIGLHDRAHENMFEWSDKTSFNYKNWYKGEPNNSGGEDCVEIGHAKSTQWNDKSCAIKANYVCKRQKVFLKVEKTTPREAVLSVIKPKNSHWAAYIIELVNLRTTETLESKHFVQLGADVTKITLPRLDPGTSYSVRVRPAKDFKEPEKWIDEASFETPVELKVEDIEERQAVLSVMTSNSTMWAGYISELTNRKNLTTTTQFHGVAQSGNVTKVNLTHLDPNTEYTVRVTPTKDDKQLKQWRNEYSFKTLTRHCDFDRNLCGFNQDSDDIFDWTRRSGPAPHRYGHLPTGPSADHNGGGSYMYIEADGRVKGDNAKLSIMITLSGRSCLSFYYHMYGLDMGSLKVTIDGESIFHKSGDQGDQWKFFLAYLSGTGNKKLVFEGIRGTSWTGDVAIDDVKFYDFQVKLTIEDIEWRKAVLSIDGGPWPAYIIELTNRQNMNVTEFRQDAQRGSVTKIDLTHLDPDTLYSVRVRPVKLGRWSNETLFKTPGIPPSFTKTPKKRIFLLIERNLTIECNASGAPKPTVKWTGSLLGPTQGRRKQQNGRLSISNVQINDSGSYTCEASNKEGVVNTTTELIVREYYFSRSDSVILSSHPDYEQKLNEYLEPVQVSGKQWKLCYKASEHNYRSAAFHTSCDRKGATVTLVRVGIYVFGGYADKSWDAPSNEGVSYTYSDKAFLFSLKNHLNEQFKMFIYRNQDKAMISRNSWGPVFGWVDLFFFAGFADLLIADRCDVNTDSSSYLGGTYKPPNGYTWGSPEAKKLLAGSYDFKCDEYEVFYQE